jgi:hypothetical protein
VTAVPADYDDDPERFAANQAATAELVERVDVHEEVADQFAAVGCRRIVDIGGGNGTLARLLRRWPTGAARSTRLRRPRCAPTPPLPFADAAFDAAASRLLVEPDPAADPQADVRS